MEFQVLTPNKPINSYIFNKDNPTYELYVRDGIFYVWGAKDAKDAQAKLDAHNPIEETPTIEEKLASVGLSLAELKAALTQ